MLATKGLTAIHQEQRKARRCRGNQQGSGSISVKELDRCVKKVSRGSLRKCMMPQSLACFCRTLEGLHPSLENRLADRVGGGAGCPGGSSPARDEGRTSGGAFRKSFATLQVPRTVHRSPSATCYIVSTRPCSRANSQYPGCAERLFAL